MVFTQQSLWVNQIRTVWSTLEKGFEVRTTTQCSTHVHVSPAQGTWTLAQVKGVAMAAVYFERSIDALVPGYRRINHWCKSNRWNHCFQRLSMAQIFQEIQKQTTIEKVAERVCLCAKDSPTGRGINAKGDFKHYTFRWNMASLASSKGTIEFRLPPPSANADQAISWIMFVVSFVRWAAQHAASKLDPSKPAELNDLLQFVVEGAQLSHVKDLSPVRNLFSGVSALPEGPLQDLKAIAPGDLEKLKAKAKERDITMEKYKKLFGYK